MTTSKRLLLFTFFLLFALTDARAEMVLFESGTLGQTGVAPSPETPAANINQFVFNGVRFSLSQPAHVSRVGGHFVGQGDFFGAIVELSNSDDFPDSSDLSTDDVLATATIEFPTLSDEVFGDLEVTLQPGDYALVFGSGLFGSSGSGGALLNNPDIGVPQYIGFQVGAGFFNRAIAADRFLFRDYRFSVSGVIVPEPSSVLAAALLLICISIFPRYL